MSQYAASPERFLEVQNFLFYEAEMLDSWRIEEWLELYSEDAEYYVPPTDLDEDASPDNSLFYIADDRRRLEERVLRLTKKTAHSEFPRSKVRHLVSNVRIVDEKDDLISVKAAFVCYRTKDGVTDTFIGRYDYQLRSIENGLQVRYKSCHLDLDGLRPHGRISIIL